jgi:hypothetical protein
MRRRARGKGGVVVNIGKAKEVEERRLSERREREEEGGGGEGGMGRRRG